MEKITTFDEVLNALALAKDCCPEANRQVFASAHARLAQLQEAIDTHAGELDWKELPPDGNDFNHLMSLLSAEAVPCAAAETG